MDYKAIRKDVLIELDTQRGKPIIWTDIYKLKVLISFNNYNDCVDFLRDLDSEGLIRLSPLTEGTRGSTDKMYKARITEAGAKYVETNYKIS